MMMMISVTLSLGSLCVFVICCHFLAQLLVYIDEELSTVDSYPGRHVKCNQLTTVCCGAVIVADRSKRGKRKSARSRPMVCVKVNNYWKIY